MEGNSGKGNLHQYGLHFKSELDLHLSCNYVYSLGSRSVGILRTITIQDDSKLLANVVKRFSFALMDAPDGK
jgi:hypothetical protein